MDNPSIVAPGQRKISLDQAFQLAVQHQSRGELPQAEQLANKIVQAEPRHSGAWQLLGILASQAGKYPLAIELMSKAIKLNPTVAQFYANRGEMYRLAGDLERAVADGEVAIKIDPRLPQALSNLGIAYYHQKRLDEAEAMQKRALKEAPDFPQALNNLGSIARDQRDRDQAEQLYRKALQASPGYTEAANNLGAVLTEQDKPQDALKLLAEIVRRHPNYGDAHCNIGNAFMALEIYDKGMLAYQRALQLRADHIEAVEGLARCALENRNPKLAEELARKAIALQPERASAHATLGTVLADNAFYDDAERAYLRALELDPDNTAATMGLGHLLLEAGKKDEAEQQFRHALANSDDDIGPRTALTQVRKAQAEDDNIKALLEMREKLATLSPTRATSLHFALGKIFEDLKDYDQAFHHFDQGCQLKNQRIPYSADNHSEATSNICKVFSQEFIDSLRGAGADSDLPIFVLGMPRSGTTLTETILASHPQVFGAGELPDLMQIIGAGQPGYPLNCANLDQQKLTAMGEQYIRQLQERAPDSPRITDKMPGNYLGLGMIHLMLPGAKIIHVRRNPVDTCLSAYTKLFNRSQYQTYNLDNLGRHYLDYARLMDHWRAVLPEDAFYEVRYESLVSNQEEETRKLLAFCKLDWDDACMTPHKTERKVKTASVTQVREPVYTSSVERWRRYETHLQPLLDVLGDLANY